MKVAVFSTKSYDREFFKKYNQNKRHSFEYFEIALNDTTTNLTIGFEAVCVFVNDKLDKSTIQLLSKNGIKLITLRCAGFNNIDLQEAHSQNIKVVRVPAYSPQAVAEHAVALILTLNRKTHKVYNRVRESNFSLDNMMGFNLYPKTVRVIGKGQIGTAFCKIILGFGCNVAAYDLKESTELKLLGVDYFCRR
jgi:D-lactate dehydrogenase